jgi:TolA-binding protein
MQADTLTDVFTGALSGSKNLMVVERARIAEIGKEIKLNLSGLVDPATAVQVGKIAGAQYMLMGSVTNLQKNKAGIVIPVPNGPKLGFGQETMEATVDIRVVKVETSEVVFAGKATGTSQSSSIAGSLWGAAFAKAGIGGLEASAIQDAAYRLAHEIRTEIAGEYSYVLGGSGNEFTLDAGKNIGVQKEMLFLAYTDGASVIGMDGKATGYRKTPFAVLKVSEADSSFSVGLVAAGCSGKLIRRGDKIEPISAADAKEMVDKDKFAKKRPDEEPIKEPIDETPPPVSSPPEKISDTPVTPAPQPEHQAPAGSYKMREVPGVDPDNTTDAKLIEAYDFLTPAERNTLGIGHRGAHKIYSSKRYKDAFEKFTRLADDYPGNYLSAYWAGECASRLKSYKEAIKWFDRALAINPNYKPAIDGRAQAEAGGKKGSKK